MSDEIYPLSLVPEGKTAVVRELRSTGSMRRRLLDIGLVAVSYTHLPDGRLLKINRKGAPAGEDGIRALTGLIREELLGAKQALLLFAGSLPPDLSPEQYKELIFSFRSDSVKIAIDSDVFSAADLAQLKPFLIKPNFVEARNLLGSCLLYTSLLIICGGPAAKQEIVIVHISFS